MLPSLVEMLIFVSYLSSNMICMGSMECLNISSSACISRTIVLLLLLRVLVYIYIILYIYIYIILYYIYILYYVAEACCDANQEDISKGNIAIDPSGNVKPSDIGAFLKKEIVDYGAKQGVEITLKYIDPSYMIRAKEANSADKKYCSYKLIYIYIYI